MQECYEVQTVVSYTANRTLESFIDKLIAMNAGISASKHTARHYANTDAITNRSSCKSQSSELVQTWKKSATHRYAHQTVDKVQ